MLLTNVHCSGRESIFGDCRMDDLKDWKSCVSKRVVQIKCRRGDFVLDATDPMRFMKQTARTSIVDDVTPPPVPLQTVRNNDVEFGIQNEQPVKSKVNICIRSGDTFALNLK